MLQFTNNFSRFLSANYCDNLQHYSWKEHSVGVYKSSQLVTAPRLDLLPPGQLCFYCTTLHGTFRNASWGIPRVKF